MRIERLEIAGFKSFAEPVTLGFHRGATAIVGPNGCGKSNLVDAVAWVLGELGARAIRARGRDLLFSGTAGRSPQGVAEVRLTVRGVAWDGMRRGPPHPGAPRELVVARRMDAEGRSVWSIGGRASTRRDVRRLFAGTGLGAGSYALIEQGRTNQVLTARPEELRGLVEEAAGLGAYRLNRKESRANLRATGRSLGQVRARLGELEHHLRRVRGEAAAAARRRQAERRAELLTLAIRARRREELLRELRECRPAAVRLKKEEDRRVRSVAAFERFVERLRGELEAADAGLRDAARKAARAREAAARAEVVLSEGQRAATARARRLEALAREERELRIRVRERAAEQAARDRRVGEFEPALAALSTRLEEARAVREAARERETTATGRVARARAAAVRREEEHRAAARAVERARDEEARLADEVERLGARRAGWNARKTRAEEEFVRAEARKTRREAGLTARRAAMGHLETANREARGAREAARAARAEADRALERIRGPLAAARARARSGRQLGRGADAVLREAGERGLAVAGAVGEAVDPDPGYERAAERLLRVHRVRVERAAEAPRIVNAMAGASSGPCELLVADLVRAAGGAAPAATGDPPRGAAPFFARIRVSDPAIRTAAAEAFVAPDLETALACFLRRPASYVTREGVLVTTPGVVRFGDGGAGEGYLVTRREVAELDAAERIAARRSAAAADASSAARARARRAAEGLAVGENAVREATIGAARAALAAERAAAAVADADRRAKEFAAGAYRLDEELGRSRTGGRRAAGRLTECAARARAARNRVAAREEVLAAAREDLDSCERVVHGLDRERARLEAVAGEVRSQTETWMREAERDAARPERIAAERAALAGDAARENQRRVEAAAERAAAAAAAARWEASEGRLAATRALLAGRIESARTALRARRTELGEVATRLLALTAARSRAESRLDDLESGFRRRSGRDLVDAAATLPKDLLARPAERIEDERSRLRARIEGMGPVNAAAEGGARELERERKKVASRLEDVERAIADGVRALERQDREAGRIFRDCRAVLSAGFDEAFRQLFGGGSAEIRLAAESEDEEGQGAGRADGLVLAARPPGKRLQSIRLLSGGEKAMTAIAFLIALFRYRPAPFCLLDEVDAPLDDANVRRFAALLEEMRRSAQLVVITHNRITMEACDRLYGVTMEEPGVSRVVSARLGGSDPGAPGTL